jgi:hypothetical protein
MNANGVPPSSPGLRGTRYPGKPSPHTFQPQRGCAPLDARSTPPDGTALRFDSSPAHSQGRPHCIPPTLGWRTESRWDRNHGTVNLHLCYANGVPSFSPGLRCTRYPGTTSPHKFQPQRGCAPCDARPTPPDGTALRFDSSSAPVPRGGLISFGQPWAGGRKPVGLVDSGINATHHLHRLPII